MTQHEFKARLEEAEAKIEEKDEVLHSIINKLEDVLSMGVSGRVEEALLEIHQEADGATEVM